MGTVLWVVLGTLYVVILVTLGLGTLRKGHVVLFIVGFILPVCGWSVR